MATKTHDEIREELYAAIRVRAEADASFRGAVENLGFFTAMHFLDSLTEIFETMIDER